MYLFYNCYRYYYYLSCVLFAHSCFVYFGKGIHAVNVENFTLLFFHFIFFLPRTLIITFIIVYIYFFLLFVCFFCDVHCIVCVCCIVSYAFFPIITLCHFLFCNFFFSFSFFLSSSSSCDFDFILSFCLVLSLFLSFFFS